MRIKAGVTLRLDRLRGIRAKLGDLSPAADRIETAVRRTIREEFAGGFEYLAGGGTREWPKTKPFGALSEGGKIAFEGSAYRDAWTQRAAAGSVRGVTAKTITIGVSIGMFPWVAVHRGSQAYTVIRPRRLAKNSADRRQKSGEEKWKSPQKWAIFWFALGHGVPLSAATLKRGLRVPSRRHAYSNPHSRAAAAKGYLDWLMEDKS